MQLAPELWNGCWVQVYCISRKHAHAIYRDILSIKIEYFHLKILIYISYYCSKHRLWVHVRTASGGSNVYPQSMFWSKNKENKYTPAHPSFAI